MACTYEGAARKLTKNDILQSLRIQKSKKDIACVKEAILERGGQISFILND